MRKLLATLALALLPLVSPVWAQTVAERDRGLIQGLLEDNLSGAGRVVRIEGFAGALSSRATFTGLTIGDDTGVWLSIDDGAISWNRAALVAGRIEIGELTAAKIVLSRLPESQAQAVSPEAVPFALPELPVAVTIGSISAARVELGEAILGSAATLKLTGSLNLAGGEGQAKLSAERIDGRAGTFSLRGSFANATRALVIDLLLDEAADGIAANLLGLQDRPALRLAVAGSGPLEGFSADLVLTTNQTKRIAGSVVLSAPDASTRRFSAKLGGDISPLLPPEYRSFFGPDVQLAAEGQRGADGSVAISALHLQSAALQIDGALNVLPSGQPQHADLQVTLGLPDAAEVLLPIGGADTWAEGGTLALGYDIAAGEVWNVAGNLAGLQRGSTRIAALDLAGSGRIAGGATAEVTGVLDFKASGVALADRDQSTALGDSAQGQVQFSWAQGAPLKLPQITAVFSGVTLTGTAEVSGAGTDTRLSGAFRIGHPNLARLAPLVGFDLGGRLDGVIEGWYAPLNGSLFVETAFLGADIKTGAPELDRMLVGGSRLRLIADRGTTGLKLMLDSNAAGFSARAEALLQSGLTSATASFSLPDLARARPGWKGALTAEATLNGVPGARVLAVTGTGSGLDLGVPSVERLFAGDATLSFSATEGQSGFALGEGALENPQVSVRLGAADDQGARVLRGRINDVSLLVSGFSGAATLSGQLQKGPSGYDLRLAADGPGGSSAAISGLVSDDLASMDLIISGRAEAGLLNSLLAPRSLQGPVGFDLTLRGAPTLASLAGRVTANGLRLADPLIGLSLQNIGFTAEIAAARAVVSGNGELGGGTMRLSGPISLQAPYMADLKLALQQVPLSDPELYDTLLSGDLSISGPLSGGAMVAGAIVLAETELRVPEGGTVLTLPNITHVGAPPDVVATRRRAGLLQRGAAQAGTGPVFGLDVSISAPRRILVRGRGLDAELGGALRLRGTTAAVEPSGQFELIRGRLDILGKRFTLTEGLVQMQGALTPWLRFAATTVTADITATITLEGPATAPELRLSSVPDLPQDEVLARLLFARGIEKLSPLQAAQMAQAVAQLAGKGGEGLMGRLRAAFGLDDLDLATDAAGATTLKLGKHLSDNIYTDVTVGDGVNINLNLDLRPGLTARGTLGADGNSGIGIYYERDY